MPRDVDLNLLRALEAIIDEQSVTRAASRLGLSQPAMSAALGKLRRHFGDELLVRVGNTYEPTPLARELRDPAATALRHVNRVFFREEEFDPATSHRAFSVVMSDYCTAVLGPPVAKRLRERAPNARLDVYSMSVDIVEGAPDSLRNYDLLVMPHGFVRDVPYRDVYEDDWVALVAAESPVGSHELTIEALEGMPWVITYDQRSAFTLITQQLRMRGVEPQVEVVVENYMTVGSLVAGSPRVAIVQERLGQIMARTGAVRMLPLPFEATPLVESMWWHPMFEDDPAHEWLRGLFTEAGIEIQ